MALCLALLSLSSSNAQVDSTTGNLVNFTGSPTSTTGNWVNGVYVNQICFQAGQPGNCGPNPSIRAESGNINFSYGTTNLNQVVDINNALSAAGTGIQLSGFNFGFRAKNGNGWDDGRQDYLSAYVKVYDSAGKVVENYDYTQYTNRQYNWSDFNFTETFNKPYNTNKLGAAQFGFIGRDNNFWAGNYGPEIMNVSFSLNYRVDPCAANPASSPTCPGFNNLIKSTNVISPSGISIAGLTTNDAGSSGTPIINVGGVQLSTTGVITAPDNIPQVLKDVQAVTQQSQPVQIQQPLASSAVQSQQQSNKSAPNMNLIMNLIGQIQAADKATQTAAVQNANQVAATSSANAQEQSMATVDNLNAMSMASSQSSQIQTASTAQMSAPPAQPTNTSAVQIQGPTTTSLQSLMTASTQSMNLNNSNTTQQTNQISYQAPANSNSSFLTAANSANRNQLGPTYNNQQLSSILSIQPVAETAPVQTTKIETKSLEPDVPAMPITSSISRSASVTEIVETKVNIETNQTEQKTETVKKNVEPNDLAGGVDIAAMATQPKGFDVYATTLMKDGIFYPPKDIYGNQKTIDNARALRSLSSDRLHQDMIDLQYRR